MKILSIFLINEIRTGGDRDYIELLELLAEKGNDVYVIINSFLNYKPVFIKPVYISVKYKRHRLPPASYLFKKSIKKNWGLVNKNILNIIPDFIHIHGDIYLKSALYLKKKLNIPLFYASRQNDIDKIRIFRKFKIYSMKEYLFSLLYQPINRYRERQIAKYADLLCFLNPYDMEQFLQRTKRDSKNVLIIPNSIGTPRFSENTHLRNHSKSIFRIVYVGSLSPAKGLWELLKAASLLKNNGFNIMYYILGRINNINRIKSFITKLGLENSVYFEDYTDPFPYFISCDLFVYPTFHDDFGNVIIESLHCGCPVISSNTTGPSYILKYDELLFNLGNYYEIAEKIRRCITDNDFYEKIRLLCNKRIKEFDFDWAEIFEKAMVNYSIQV